MNLTQHTCPKCSTLRWDVDGAVALCSKCRLIEQESGDIASLIRDLDEADSKIAALETEVERLRAGLEFALIVVGEMSNMCEEATAGERAEKDIEVIKLALDGPDPKDKP